IVDRGHDRKVVVVAYEMFDHPRTIAMRDAVAANERGLQVARLDDELVAVPTAGREALVRVPLVRGRVRSAVHPDRAREPVTAVDVIRDEPLRDGVVLFHD